MPFQYALTRKYSHPYEKKYLLPEFKQTMQQCRIHC